MKKLHKYNHQEMLDHFAKHCHLRASAGALFFNSQNELLMVKASYKDHWSIPGGIVEKGESPMKACQREITEEIGIKNAKLKFAGVVYLLSSKYKGDESLQFFFLGEKVKLTQIKIDNYEIIDYKFVPVNEVYKYNKGISMKLQNGLNQLLKNGACYLEEYR